MECQRAQDQGFWRLPTEHAMLRGFIWCCRVYDFAKSPWKQFDNEETPLNVYYFDLEDHKREASQSLREGTNGGARALALALPHKDRKDEEEELDDA